MKPISLKLSGLQSYRSMQEIDFTALCDTGLFGIFGPTGSGKSTILDAITLAMYGKVGRASGGTQGIMNHSEESLFVAFTFELMSASGEERYRVERRFKRQGDISVSNTISRFIEISPEGEKVVADKLAEVTRCVEEKIGLKMDDFTRAVVLPQGKFADFLSLKGAERRAMLQRLFHLEKYGDLLAQKLSRKVKENDQALKELAAEQQGLGEASEAALRETEAALKAAAALAETRRSELDLAQRRSDQLAKVRELSLERSARAAQLAVLRERDSAVAELEARLAAAAAAERIRPALTAWKEAQQLAASRVAAAAVAREAAEAAAGRARTEAAAAEVAAAELGREEPALLLRLDQLEQAKLLQAECEQLLAEAKSLATQREQASVQHRQLGEELSKQEQLLAKAQQRKQELEEQLKSNEVKASERRSLQDALSRHQGISSAREVLGKAEADESKHLAKAREASARLETLAQEAAGLVRERSALTEKAGEARERLALLAAATAELAVRIETCEAAMKRTAKERDEHQWSLRLAEALSQGDPCPVCGSTEHPSPAATDMGAALGSVNSGSELEQAGVLLGQARDLRYAVSRDSDAWDSLASTLEAALEEASAAASARLEAAVSQAAVAAHPARSSHTADFVPGVLETDLTKEAQTIAVLAQQYEELKREQIEWREGFADLERGVKAITLKLAEIQTKQASAAAEAASIAQLAEQAQRSTAQYREALALLLKEWDLEHPGLSPEEAAVRMEQIHERDQATEEIKQRLALSIPFIEEKTANIAQLQKEITELDKALLQWELQEQGKQELLRDKKSRLTAWIGEESADELLQSTRQRIDWLRTQAETAKRRQAEADTERQRCSQADALAQQAAADAQQQEAKLQEHWRTELEASPFGSEQQAAEAIMDKERMGSIEEEIQSHRDAERELMMHLKELEAKLEGQNVSEEEWQECSEALRLAKEQDEAALQLKARTQRDLEYLGQRHIRWQELEKIRLKREHEAGLLAKLQSSLRGNAFVEYVAEEQLMNVSQAASQRLRFLTNQRYALECDSGGGFVICDDANGGVKRPVATLSGGETFLTSLALALALSAQIQLRGQYPLQFFFLDEGFGTLDPELLDTVITSLEHLHHDHLSVGIISHVAELRARLARKLIVVPAESGGEGSRVILERL